MKKRFMLKLTLILAGLLLSGCGPDEGAEEASTDIKNSRVIKEIQDCKDCPEMVLIPKGHFMMGALPYDKQADKYEKPRHPVEIQHDFYMGKYEVTYGQYMACVREESCSFTPPDMLAECHKRLGCSAMYRKEPVDINKLPVVRVSYNDAIEYVTWLSKKTGQQYRLPTEEEWEYAARGGTETIFWWGDEMEDGRTMCSDCDSKNRMQDLPLHVGNYPPNPFGLHDILGNAQEITEGCFIKFFAVQREQNLERKCLIRTLRGGAWDDHIFKLRASYRVGSHENRAAAETFTEKFLVSSGFKDFGGIGILFGEQGFRIVKSLNEQDQGDEK